MAKVKRNETRFDEGGNRDWLGTLECDRCGREVDVMLAYEPVCECGANYNRSGQQLRDDWRGNPSNYDDEVGDMEGFEIQHAGDE